MIDPSPILMLLLFAGGDTIAAPSNALDCAELSAWVESGRPASATLANGSIVPIIGAVCLPGGSVDAGDLLKGTLP